MWTKQYRYLVAVACRHNAAGHAEDLVQEALLEALIVGRSIEPQRPNLAWLAGVVRNKARMLARTEVRQKEREGSWDALRNAPSTENKADPSMCLSGLSPALISVAMLAMTGHNRREIAYLLNLTDMALRQRIAALRRHFVGSEITAPSELSGLRFDLPYGRIRSALLRHLPRERGSFASHDPDGHLFVITRSQKH